MQLHGYLCGDIKKNRCANKQAKTLKQTNEAELSTQKEMPTQEEMLPHKEMRKMK